MQRVDLTARRALRTAAALLLATLGACAPDDDDDATSAAGATAAPTAESVSSTVATTMPPTTIASTTAAGTTAPVTSSSPATTASTTTAVPTSTTEPVPEIEEFVLGESVEGRPITAFRRGTRGGTAVLVIGVIHGDEDAGFEVAEQLRTLPVPDGIDLWVVPSVNPDGQAAQIRHNANGVDLNRNFPHDWTPIAQPGEWEYSGTGPASEPETQAFIAFAERINPELTLWYHQDLWRLSPSTGRDGPLRQRYAEVSGLPIEPVTGGTYTGVAATWVRRTVPDAMSFIIELGETLPADELPKHVAAVLSVAEMVRDGAV
jgi:protein MpaA